MRLRVSPGISHFLSGMILDALTERVIAAIIEVSNTLGAGFLEKVYHRALLHELHLCGIRAVAEAPFAVTYKGREIGEYFPDILVEDVLLLELKCTERISNEHIAQCLNYLRASGLTLCLLINFQRPKVEWKRIILTHPSACISVNPRQKDECQKNQIILNPHNPLIP